MLFLCRYYQSIKQGLNSMPDNLAFLPPKSSLFRLFANRKRQSLCVMYATICLQALMGLTIGRRVTPTDNMIEKKTRRSSIAEHARGAFVRHMFYKVGLLLAVSVVVPQLMAAQPVAHTIDERCYRPLEYATCSLETRLAIQAESLAVVEHQAVGPVDTIAASVTASASETHLANVLY